MIAIADAKICECCLQTQKGARFVSETDTEVIVKLSKYIYDNSETKPTFPEVRPLPARYIAGCISHPRDGLHN